MHVRPIVLTAVLLPTLLATFAGARAQSPDPASPLLAERPERWFLEQIGGKRIVLDGQTLDARVQYRLQQDRVAQQAQAPSQDDPGATAAGRAELRRAANQRWIEGTRPAADDIRVEDQTAPARDGKRIPVRIYRPRTTDPLPLLVYFHGGGWLFGDIEAVDRAVRRMADQAQVVAISVDYRLAPEAPYPAAWNDAEDAYGWVVANAGKLGGDAARICVGGDSAGGNLAIAVSTRRLQTNQAPPACQLLYYPAVDNRAVPAMRADYASSRLFGAGFGLDYSFTEYVLARVFPGRDLAAAEISPLFATDVARLPPTLVAASGFDPLRDSDRAYAERLRQAGVPTLYREYPTLTHGFLQLTAITDDADHAAAETARLLGALIRGTAFASTDTATEPGPDASMQDRPGN